MTPSRRVSSTPINIGVAEECLSVSLLILARQSAQESSDVQVVSPLCIYINVVFFAPFLDLTRVYLEILNEEIHTRSFRC